MAGGQLKATRSNGVTTDTASTPFTPDGETHHVAVAVYPDTLDRMVLYLDGVLMDQSLANYAAASNTLNVGRGNPDEFVGVIAHVAFFEEALSATRIAAHANAGLNGFTGETTDARAGRYAEYARIPGAEVDAEVSTITMAHIDTTDASAVDMLRLAEATEGGVLFDDRDGTLRLHSQAHRVGATPAVSLSMAGQQVEADYAPRLDRSALVNDARVTSTDNAVKARWVDQASVDEYGPFGVEVQTGHDDPEAAFDMALRLVQTYAEPRLRVPSLTVDVLNCGADMDDLLALNVGSLIEVTGLPSQAGVRLKTTHAKAP